MKLVKDFQYKGDTLKVMFVSPSEFYDRYAPTVYGNILKIVKREEIAEKVLEKVFKKAIVDQDLKRNEMSTTLNALINHSFKISNSTLKALQIIEAVKPQFKSE